MISCSRLKACVSMCLEKKARPARASVRIDGMGAICDLHLGRMHPHPCPTWQSYIFPDTVVPNEAPVVIE